MATSTSAVAQERGLTGPEVLGFLVQCRPTGGRPFLPSVARPGCAPDTLQRLGDAVRWRKHDYGDRDDAAAASGGYQVSDAVLDRQGGLDVVIQTFDFGDGERLFRRFDAGRGDGGDFIAVVEGAAYGILTEDGGGGTQWFVGAGCRDGGEGRLKSWLFFRPDARRGEWRETVAELNIARSAAECPARFGQAFTRYRRDTIPVPVRMTSAAGTVTRASVPVDTIVSEHFGRGTLAEADHLERFFFGRGFGKYRWERWEHRTRTLFPDKIAEAGGLARSGRCPSLPYSRAPADGFVMTDCRFWTNLVEDPRPFAVKSYGWPTGSPFGPAGPAGP